MIESISSVKIENYDTLNYEQLKILKLQIENEIKNYNSKINKIKNLYINIDNLTYKKCNHNWIKESSCAAYERPAIYCNKCLSYKK